MMYTTRVHQYMAPVRLNYTGQEPKRFRATSLTSKGMLKQNPPIFHGVRTPCAPPIDAALEAAPLLPYEVDAVAHAPRRHRRHCERRLRAHEDRLAAGEPLDLLPSKLGHIQPVHLEADHVGELGVCTERCRDFSNGHQLPDEEDLTVALDHVSLSGESRSWTRTRPREEGRNSRCS